MTQRGENLAQASFPEMEEAKAALHGLEGLESEPSQVVRRYDGPRDPDALLAHLGYDGFRPGQREPVEAALAGRDSLVVMPTGGGKSLCYQLPGLASDELTIVVSPLIALMADQWRRLSADGHPAVMIASGLPGGGGARRDGADPRRPGPDRLLLAGALRPARLHERGRASARSTCSRSTRPTASPSGATTSAPTTCGCRGCSSGSAARR